MPVTEPRRSDIQYITTHGHRLAYIAHPDTVDTHPVVFIHGLTASVRFWEAAMYEYVENQHAWYSVSLPYHYPSVSPTDQPLDERMFAAMLHDVLAVLSPDRPVHLVGYSLGGFMALNYAAKYADRVCSIISIGGFANGRTKGLDGMLQFLSKGDFFRKGLFHLGWNTMRLHPFFLKMAVLLYANDWRALLRYPALDDTIARIYPDVRKHPVEGIRSLFRYLLDMNVMDEITCLNMPVLTIAGEHDPVIPYEHQKAYTQVLPYGKLLSLPGTGHVAFAERPTEVKKAIIDWLLQQDREQEAI